MKIKFDKEKLKLKKGKKSKSKVVTQANLEESRDEVLARGRKFRYPFQYAKHKIMINATLLGLVAVIIFAVIGWAQLYKFNSTGEVIYRFTRVLPVSVAKIGDVRVRYSDYLLLYRSSVASIEHQQGKFDDSVDAQTQLALYKRQALTMAEDYSYAMAKLEEMGKPVTDEEIEEVLNAHRMIDGELRSEESFAGIIRANFDLNLKEYRRMIELTLAKKKYSELADNAARDLMNQYLEVGRSAEGGFAGAMEQEAFKDNDKISYEKTNDFVSLNNLDGGRAAVAFKLDRPGDISEVFVSTNGDCLYVVKLYDKTEKTVSYESVAVRFTQMGEELKKLRDEGKVDEKIQLEEEKAEEERKPEAEEKAE